MFVDFGNIGWVGFYLIIKCNCTWSRLILGWVTAWEKKLSLYIFSI